KLFEFLMLAALAPRSLTASRAPLLRSIALPVSLSPHGDTPTVQCTGESEKTGFSSFL
ncbi:MAG: hypothetical protein PWR21_1912, partial [Methanoculleus sp.]|nr:hypothetical protein [Methanoculleus sp.]